jgi:hypothetical protein
MLSGGARKMGIAIQALVAILLTVHAGLLGWIAVRSSPTIDEVAHLPAGVAILKLGRFELYRVNPPLVKSLAALPVVLAAPKTNWTELVSPGRREWDIGFRFIDANGDRVFWYFTLARWACIPLSLVGGYVCFRWAADLYGRASGLLALVLWCFSPTVLAYGSLITPDLGATAVGVLASYLFWRWLERPTWTRAMASGLALGAAELTKMTWLIAFVLWPALWLAWWLSARIPFALARRQAAQLAIILVTGLYVLNMGYCFEGTLSKLGRYPFVSETFAGVPLRGKGTGAFGNRFAGTWAAEISVPLPSPYLIGLDQQKSDFDVGMKSYLRGEFRHGGWWYFYLYALAIKEPLGTWLLVAMAAALSILARGYAAGWRREMILLAPCIAVLVLVSSQMGFSKYVRYVLPGLPYVLIWVSKTARSFSLRHQGCAWAVGGAAAWMVVSSLSIYPYCLSYFNELVGGPTKGHEHLIDASIDWGQGMFDLKRWYDRNPEARPLYLDLFNNVEMKRFGIEELPIPHPLSPGWYAISLHRLHEEEGNRPFMGLRPIAMVGYSIAIYYLTREDAERLQPAPKSPAAQRPPVGLGGSPGTAVVDRTPFNRSTGPIGRW